MPTDKQTFKQRFNNISIPQKEDFLKQIFKYCLNIDKNITQRSLDNIRLYQDLVVVGGEGSKLAKDITKAIGILVELRLEGLIEHALLISELDTHNFDDKSRKVFIELNETYVLEKQSILFINKKLHEIVKFYHIYDFYDEAVEIADRLDTGDFDSIEEIATMTSKLVEEVLEKTDEAFISNDSIMVNLNSKESLTMMSEANESSQSSENVLKTQIQRMNEMLNGGFFNSKFYLFGAPPKEGKSLLAKDLADQIRAANTYTCKETNVVPAIFYIINENTIQETFERDFIKATGMDFRTARYTNDQVIEILGNYYGYGKDDSASNKIRIILWRTPDDTIDYKNIGTEIKKLYINKNIKIVCVIDDYFGTKKKPNVKEERLKYSELAKQAKNLATSEDIPVITFHQLSRMAEIAVAEARAAGSDPVMSIHTGMMSESAGIFHKVDWLGALCQNTNPNTGQDSMQLRQLGSRYTGKKTKGSNKSKIQFIDHPLDGLKMIPDLHLPNPLSNIVPHTISGANTQPGMADTRIVSPNQIPNSNMMEPPIRESDNVMASF